MSFYLLVNLIFILRAPRDLLLVSMGFLPSPVEVPCKREGEALEEETLTW